MSKKRPNTIMEWKKQIVKAENDLTIMRFYLEKLKIPTLMSDNQHTFLYNMYGLDDGIINYKMWETKVDMEVERIENWLIDIRKYLMKIEGKPIRSCLPLKKQRALGLLPPVSGRDQ